MDEILLSVIIPVFNCEKYIDEAIRSVIQQPTNSIEAVIIDDGSTDASVSIIDHYAGNDRVQIVHKKNEGVCVARNVGIDIARGKYINFLDHDDVICRGAYNDELATLLKKESFDAVAMELVYANEKITKGRILKRENGRYLRQEDKAFNNRKLVHHQKSLLKKSAVEEVYFPPGITYREDLAYYALAYDSVNSAISLDIPWYIWRNQITSVSHNRKRNDRKRLNYWIGAFVYGFQNAKTEYMKTCMAENILRDACNFITDNTQYGENPEILCEKVANDKDVQMAYDYLGYCNEAYERFVMKINNDPDGYAKEQKKW